MLTDSFMLAVMQKDNATLTVRAIYIKMFESRGFDLVKTYDSEFNNYSNERN